MSLLRALSGVSGFFYKRSVWSFRTPFGHEHEHFFCSFLYRVFIILIIPFGKICEIFEQNVQ